MIGDEHRAPASGGTESATPVTTAGGSTRVRYRESARSMREVEGAPNPRAWGEDRWQDPRRRGASDPPLPSPLSLAVIVKACVHCHSFSPHPPPPLKPAIARDKRGEEQRDGCEECGE